MVFPFSLCQLGMSGMSGMPFPLFPLSLNPEGPRDMFWLLSQTAHCPGILGEVEDFCLCAAPAPTPGQTGAGPCHVKASHKGPALSEILRQPSPAACSPMPVLSAGVTLTGEAEPSWGWSFLGNFMYFPSLLLLDMQNTAAVEFMMPQICV